MRVARMIVPPAAVGAGLAAMIGDFTTDDVSTAVRSANDDAGMDPGEMTGDEFAMLVARRLIDKALAAEKIVALGDDLWRGPQGE
jgi:hypothetical protein